jgi:excisionase family DNA binding protein
MLNLTGVDPYMSLHDLSAYSGMSKRRLRQALADPVHPLPHYRPGGGKVLVRRSEFDQWLARFRRDRSDVDRLLSEITKEVTR